jgi:hypothetical protein
MKNLICITLTIVLFQSANLLAQPMKGDLIITNLIINKYGIEPIQGTPQYTHAYCEFTAEIKNNGYAAFDLNNQYGDLIGFFSADDKHVTGDGDGVVGGSKMYPKGSKSVLKPGESLTITDKIWGGNKATDKYFILEVVQEVYDEMFQNNNQKAVLINAGQFPFNPQPTIDLIVQSATNFQYAYNNTQVQYSYAIKNLGNADCTQSVGLQGYWSKDNIKSTDDVPAGGIVVGPITITQAKTGSFTMNVPNPSYYPTFLGWSLPKMIKYYPYLILVIDSNSQVTESNESNNVLAFTIGL